MILAAIALAGCGSAGATESAPGSRTGAAAVTSTSAAPSETYAPNPFELYPRRPGAQGRDVERRVGGTVAFEPMGDLTVVGARRYRHPSATAATPSTSTSAPANGERPQSPSAFAPEGATDVSELLVVVVQSRKVPADLVSCFLTVVSDGRVFEPFDVQGGNTSMRAASRKPHGADTSELRMTFAIGPVPGPFDVSCTVNTGFLFPDLRGVWRVDA